MNDKTKIAGLKNISQWKALKVQLQSAPTRQSNWEKAFSEFLFQRITTRYFEPIDAIAKISTRQGKGFSIVAIYCSLIEFFETLKKGFDFKHPNYLDTGGQLVRSTVILDRNGIGQPLNNKEIFVNFLTQNAPFNKAFTNVLADSFYHNVRCSILHQAETQLNWLIKDGTSKDEIIHTNSDNSIHLRWRPLKEAFHTYLVDTYKNQLLTDPNTQNNFIFKWDKICDI